ncbi:helix-turn-helix domain-containing protein [Embleya sp. MST-111070]|uniref:helix-turn-helix domain-containing protein n=1 Tax=Embleya sp. MST-111070 TaxID=3398231 RepID=UPI003F741891
MSEQRTAEYREALFGWYAAIRYAHRTLVRSADWYADNPTCSEQFDTFGAMLAPPASRQTWSGDQSADAWRELLLMMNAWSPYTLEALSEILPGSAETPMFRGWGSGFEPAGRDEAHAVASALARVLTPDERDHVLAQVARIGECDDAIAGAGYVETLVDDSRPCTSNVHETFGDSTAERRECARARATVMRVAPRDDRKDRREHVARASVLLLGSRRDRMRHLVAHVRKQLATEVLDDLPVHCREHAAELADVRKQCGFDEHKTAELAGISVATLQRLENGRTKTTPGKASCLGYLTLLAAASLEAGRAHECVPAVLSSAVATSGFVME